MEDNPYTSGEALDESGYPLPSALDVGTGMGMNFMGLPAPGDPTREGTPYETLSAIASFMGNALPGKGTVYAGTPVAEKYLNFMRSVWPSLMKKADSLRDIEVRHVPGITDNAVGRYFPKEYLDKMGEGIKPNMDLIEFAGDRDVKSTLATLIHELLHPIYRAKGSPKDVPEMTNEQMRQFLGKYLSANRLEQFAKRKEPGHAVLDAQAQNILRSRINKPNVNAPANFWKQGLESKNMEYDFPQ